MTYSEAFALSLGAAETGLTLKAALVATDGTIDGSLRDITSGFTEIGVGHYLWYYSSFPVTFAGNVVFYTGTLGVASDFTGVTVKDHQTPRTATILSESRILRDIIESQRDDHSQVGLGNTFYIDQANGDTHANGARGGWRDPYSSAQDCHDNAVVDGNHDIMFFVPSGGAGQTVHDEQLTISKDYVFLRAPGSGLLLTSTSAGDVLTITGEGVEVSSIEVQTHTAGSGKGVVLSGDFAQVRHCVVSRTRGDGITVTDASKTLIEHCRLYNTGLSGSGNGISVVGTSSTTQFTTIKDNEIYDTQGNAIDLTGANTDNTTIFNNKIADSTNWGVSIGSGVTSTIVAENYFSNNGSGRVDDQGTNSDVERNLDWPTAAEVSQEALGNGSRQVTVTVEDTSANRLSDQKVNVYSSSGNATGVFGRTDANGQVIFQLDDDDYEIGITNNSGYEAHTPEALTVDGTEAMTITLTPVSVSSPPSSELCTVFTYVKINGTVIQGATLSAKLVSEDSTVDEVVLSLQKSTDTTDANGYAELFLVKENEFLTGDGIYHIWVDDANGDTLISFETTIPDLSTESVQDLLSTVLGG